MKRKILLIIALALTLVTCLGVLTACPLTDIILGSTTGNGGSDPDQFGYGDDFRLIREMKMNEEKHLLVYNKTENLSFEELVLAQAIQGIYARTNARY